MADEFEGNQDVDGGAGSQPLENDAGTTEPASGVVTGNEGGTATPESENQSDIDYKGEYTKLQESQKELQAKFTQSAQEAAQNAQLLRTISPYVDYARYQGQGGPTPNAADEDPDDDEYVGKKEVEKRIEGLKSEFSQRLMAQTVRAKYPDVCDNGPNEVLVRHFMQSDQFPYKNAEERIAAAVKKTREHLQTLKSEGMKEAKSNEEKAAVERRAKEAAAAKASGLSASGNNAPPAPQEDNNPVSADSYAENERNERMKRRNL